MRTLIKLLFAAYVTWLALAFLVVLPLLNIMAPRLVADATGRELSTNLIFFNPFSLAVVAHQAVLPDPDGEHFVRFDLAEVNLSLASLWKPGIVLDRAALKDLDVQVRRLDAERFSFSDLLGEDSEPAPETEASTEIPGLTVDDLHLSAQRIAYVDLAREEPFTSELTGIEINVTGLSTVLEDGKPYRIIATGDGGGRLNWTGDVSIPGSHSAGRLELTGLPLDPMWRFARPMLNLRLDSGRLDIGLNYDVNWGADEVQYLLSEGTVAVRNLELNALTETESAVSFAEFALSGLAVNGPNSSVDIQTMALQELSISGFIEDDVISLQDMFAIDLPEDAETGDLAEESESSDTESAWRVFLAEFRMPDARVNWRSPYTEPAQLAITPLSLTARNVHWPAEETATIDLDLAVNERAQLAVDAEVIPSTSDASITLALTDLPVPWFSPNLPDQLNTSFDSGAIDTQLEAQLVEGEPTTLQTDGELRDLTVNVRGVNGALTTLRALRWHELDVDMQAHTARMKRLRIDGYAGRLHIFEDGSINTQRMLEDAVEDAQAEAAAEAATHPEEVEDSGSDWQFLLPLVRITDSSLDFMDESLPINFRTIIGDLNGEISNLTLDPDETAEVDLKGLVDEYAPVLLSGTARPTASPPALDLALTFTGVDMVRLTPYTGNYAGYNIDRGLLNLDLNYNLENDHMEGSNKVVIKQLKLGQKVDSEDAADLPLELAVALLSDSNGVIDLAVPVSGDIEDPEFELGAVIGKAIMNALTKIVTAPFKLLAGLAGSDEDLETVSFPPGSPELNSIAREKLDTLALALGQRPQLLLGVTGQTSDRGDVTALKEETLSAEMAERGLSETDRKEMTPAWVNAVTELYAANPAPPPAEGEPQEAPSPARMYKHLLSQVSISESQRAALADQRAGNTKAYLVNEAGIPADRVFINTAEQQAGSSLGGVSMSVDN